MPESDDSLQATVFANRGIILALPAVALGVFGKPNAKSIALGLPLAFAGEFIRCWAVGYSGATTREDHVIAKELVTAGPYAYVRNPLYVGNFLTAAGFAVAFTGNNGFMQRWLMRLAGLGVMAGVYATIIPHEEAYLRETFGDSFDHYVERVPAYLPASAASEPQSGSFDPSVIAAAESRTFITFAAMLAMLAIKAPKT